MYPEKAPWHKESPFEKLKKELEAEGYAFVGSESLTRFHFDESTARFIAVPDRTKEEIIQEYVKRFQDKTEVDVKLVDETNLDQKQQAVYVFIKPKKK